MRKGVGRNRFTFGALRNGNSKGFRDLGPDTGFDSIGDWPQIDRLAAYLDELAGRGSLPKDGSL